MIKDGYNGILFKHNDQSRIKDSLDFIKSKSLSQNY